ncbi:adenylate cyclase CyaD2 [Desulfovibrionales bacterium]
MRLNLCVFKKIILYNLGLGICIGCCSIALYIIQPKFFAQIDLKIYDTYLRSLPHSTPSSLPVLVDIDEQSLAAYGQWPWPRYRLAALVDKISQAGAASIALDILLAEPDRTSPARLQEQLERDFGLRIAFEGLPPEIEDNDAIFAHVLGQNTVTLGCYFHFTNAESRSIYEPRSSGIIERGALGAQPATTHVPQALSVAMPLPQFAEAASVAFYNVSADADGLVRRVPLMLATASSLHPSLALKTLMQAIGVDNLIIHTNVDGMNSIGCGELEIPVAPDGSMPVLFRGGAGMYPYVSAKDILEGNATASLAGKIVFIGTSATGLRDIRSTPFDQHYPGVEVHAAVIDALTTQRFLQIPPWTPGLQVLTITCTALLCILFFGMTKALIYIPTGLCMAGGFWFGGSTLFAHGYFVSPLYVLLTIGAEGFFLLALRFWHEEHQKRHIHLAFSRYVAPEVVQQILSNNRGATALAGEERIVTLLFTDIRGFTSLSEHLSPHQVVTLLNRYFTPMTALVRGSKGTLDKFIGDAIMAFWNAPLDVPDHAAQAVRTALRMHQALRALNTALAQDFGVSLRIGAGIHTGPVFVGNMGTNELLSYTAIGDNVNLASRLEGLCPVYGVSTIVSQETRELCAELFTWQHLDTVRVKGKELPVSIFTPIEHDEARARSAELQAHERAFAAYVHGDFATAQTEFTMLSAAYACPLYQIFAQRCAHLAANPPQSWDGVWTLTSK